MPQISLFSEQDPLGKIVGSSAYAECTEFFLASPARARALVTPQAQALMYLMLRKMRPAAVVEIGTYRASTTEALARALYANGSGILHTVDPFGGETVPPLLAAWPKELLNHLKFHEVHSMDFFAWAARTGFSCGMVFVDGNYDYEFALFDLLSSARFVAPGGLILVDNVSQAGPYFAVADFLKQNPAWREWGGRLPSTM